MSSKERKDFLLGLIKNDEAKRKVKQLNAAGEAVINIENPPDKTLAAYKQYRKEFDKLKTRFPDWESKLNKPIEYSSFILDYVEPVYKNLAKSEGTGKTAVEMYTLKMHGINLQSIDILYQKLVEKEGKMSKWADRIYFESHIKDAYSLLRTYFDNDEEYDEVFSPKEERILF